MGKFDIHTTLVVCALVFVFTTYVLHVDTLTSVMLTAVSSVVPVSAGLIYSCILGGNRKDMGSQNEG